MRTILKNMGAAKNLTPCGSLTTGYCSPGKGLGKRCEYNQHKCRKCPPCSIHKRVDRTGAKEGFQGQF